MRTLFVFAVIVCSFAAGMQGQAPRETRREVREKERAARQARFEWGMDSLIISHSFTFLPTTFTMQPLGRMQIISNPNFRIDVYPSFVDVCLPFIYGRIAPYIPAVIDQTVTRPEAMLYKQTRTGWDISFRSSLFKADTFRFRFTVNATTGEAILEVQSDANNTISYTGAIVGR